MLRWRERLCGRIADLELTNCHVAACRAISVSSEATIQLGDALSVVWMSGYELGAQIWFDAASTSQLGCHVSALGTPGLGGKQYGGLV